MQESHTHTRKHTHIYTCRLKIAAAYLSVHYHVGGLIRYPVGPLPTAVGLCHDPVGKSATGNVRCSCWEPKGYFGPSEEQWSLNVTCPHLVKRKTIYITCGLHHLLTYLTFPHGTDVHSSNSATRVHISQGLDKDILFMIGSWFCTPFGFCWFNMNSKWMRQKFNKIGN